MNAIDSFGWCIGWTKSKPSDQPQSNPTSNLTPVQDAPNMEAPKTKTKIQMILHDLSYPCKGMEIPGASDPLNSWDDSRVSSNDAPQD
ncbi:hypothetical protein Ancab_038407 [Ancistrocladus abbreviatus]